MLLLGVGALVLLANPRHREFYFGDPAAGVAGARAVPAASAFSLLSAPRGARVPGAPVRAAASGSRRIPTADAEGRVRVPVADAIPARLPADGVPPGWALQAFAGEAAVELVRDEGRLAMRLRSERASFALYRHLVVDLEEFPLLTWSWRVMRLPPAGDVREADRDDQAAQVYVVFPRWPSPLTNSDVLGYIWDSRAPIDTRLVSPRAPNVRIIVVESGPGRLDTWRQYRRNVAEDYVALFGRQPPRVGKVAVMIDSDDTRAAAEALIGDLVFSRGGSESMEIPTSMLR